MDGTDGLLACTVLKLGLCFCLWAIVHDDATVKVEARLKQKREVSSFPSRFNPSDQKRYLARQPRLSHGKDPKSQIQ